MTKNLEPYKAALETLAAEYEILTGEKIDNIVCGSDAGRRKIAAMIFPDWKEKNEGYRLNSCFELGGIWHTLSAVEYMDNQALEIRRLKKELADTKQTMARKKKPARGSVPTSRPPKRK